jgi:hypothetical protein
MPTTTLLLFCHAKVPDRASWAGGDRARPLVDRGRAQAERLARALQSETLVLIASSLWLRCAQTAAADYPGRAVVGVSHSDLIREVPLESRVVGGLPRLRDGSLLRLKFTDRHTGSATLLDRSELKEPGR